MVVEVGKFVLNELKPVQAFVEFNIPWTGIPSTYAFETNSFELKVVLVVVGRFVLNELKPVHALVALNIPWTGVEST